MCLALPGRVTEVVDATKCIGRVEIFGTPRLVNLGVLDEVTPGDWVLVRVGLAVEKIDEATAQETMRLLEELRGASEQAVAPLVGEEDEP
jgi:hydrogenase expression/formation protein HypC